MIKPRPANTHKPAQDRRSIGTHNPTHYTKQAEHKTINGWIERYATKETRRHSQALRSEADTTSINQAAKKAPNKSMIKHLQHMSVRRQVLNAQGFWEYADTP